MLEKKEFSEIFMMAAKIEIVVATTNQGKLAELRTMLQPHDAMIRGLNEFPDIPPAPEEGATFAENARQTQEWWAKKMFCHYCASRVPLTSCPHGVSGKSSLAGSHSL